MLNPAETLLAKLSKLANDQAPQYYFFGPDGNNNTAPEPKDHMIYMWLVGDVIHAKYSFGGPEEDILYPCMRRLGYSQTDAKEGGTFPALTYTRTWTHPTHGTATTTEHGE